MWCVKRRRSLALCGASGQLREWLVVSWCSLHQGSWRVAKNGGRKLYTASITHYCRIPEILYVPVTPSFNTPWALAKLPNAKEPRTPGSESKAGHLQDRAGESPRRQALSAYGRAEKARRLRYSWRMTHQASCYKGESDSHRLPFEEKDPLWFQFEKCLNLNRQFSYS
jgi:hypothetical protein